MNLTAHEFVVENPIRKSLVFVKRLHLHQKKFISVDYADESRTSLSLSVLDVQARKQLHFPRSLQIGTPGSIF